MTPEENADGVQLGEIDDRRQNSDRRGSLRRKILKRGLTFWPNGDSSECTVYNLSETGAQLELRGVAPNLFDLVVEGDNWRRKCCVVWRKTNRVGVKFQEQSLLELSSRKQPVDFSRYVEECKMLANRAAPSDRALLLEMAEAWAAVIIRLQKKSRRQSNPGRVGSTASG
jgi:hypothetical protein